MSLLRNLFELRTGTMYQFIAVRLKDNEIDRASYEHTASELDKALTNFGFAYSTNHGIAQEKVHLRWHSPTALT